MTESEILPLGASKTENDVSIKFLNPYFFIKFSYTMKLLATVNRS